MGFQFGQATKSHKRYLEAGGALHSSINCPPWCGPAHTVLTMGRKLWSQGKGRSIYFVRTLRGHPLKKTGWVLSA